ncbi:hypothetical protein ABGB12_16900 [Actinocorallia sp. B10E7]|uniref:hypothetical protein n=1 Tax=Actinocorallia sp. B10E7 TaxID=3153558 RepID=UPI00325E0398
MNRDKTPLDRVLAALTVPAHRSELDGRDRALAAFREAVAHPLPATQGNPVKSTLAKLLTLKVGVAALCVTVLGGGVALATGAVPLPGKDEKSVSHDRDVRLAPKSAPSNTPSTGSPTARPTPSGSPEVRLAALCQRILRDPKGREWRLKPAETRGAAYAALVKAAGGKDEVYDYCLSLKLPSAEPKASSRSSAKPTDKPGNSPSVRPSKRPTSKPDRPSTTRSTSTKTTKR